jgi:hypothetical protein
MLCDVYAAVVLSCPAGLQQAAVAAHPCSLLYHAFTSFRLAALAHMLVDCDYVCCCAVLQGYTKLLSVLGSNIAEFLQNLNNLHLHLSYCWPDMIPPAFRCEQVWWQH